MHRQTKVPFEVSFPLFLNIIPLYFTHFSYTLALIGLGILTAGLSYVASIFYLYLHYEANQRYTTKYNLGKNSCRSKYSTAMRFLYAVILIFSTIATAFHFHGYY